MLLGKFKYFYRIQALQNCRFKSNVAVQEFTVPLFTIACHRNKFRKFESKYKRLKKDKYGSNIRPDRAGKTKTNPRTRADRFRKFCFRQCDESDGQRVNR